MRGPEQNCHKTPSAPSPLPSLFIQRSGTHSSDADQMRGSRCRNHWYVLTRTPPGMSSYWPSLVVLLAGVMRGSGVPVGRKRKDSLITAPR